jgi:hypothetical protein
MIKWKTHYSVWKASCNKKPIGSIKITNSGYTITQPDNSVIKLQGFWLSLSMLKLMIENSYLIQKELYE